MKKLFFILLLFLIFLIPNSIKAQNSQKEYIQEFESQITIQTDASIIVSEKIDYYFPSPKHGIYRYIPIIYEDKEGKKFELKLTIKKIFNEKGSAIPYSTSKNGNNIEIKIGDPDKTVTGLQVYNIEYSLLGAINYFDDHDELYWNVTGTEWEVPIEKSKAEVILPASASEDKITYKCFTGQYGSREENCQSNIENGIIDFSANDNLTIVVGFEKGIVAVIDKSYVYTGFESAWFLLIPFFTLILLLFLLLKYGRDPLKIKTIAPEFEPPKNLTPAEMGAIIDEKVNKSDLTSNIIYWASKGYIKIREEEKSGIFGGKDYTLIKLKELPENAKEYEKSFFNTMFSQNEIKLSELKKRRNFLQNFHKIPNELYDELVKNEYFPKNPQKIRYIYLGIGIALLIMTIPLGVLVQSFTLGISLFLSALMIIIVGKFMPRKTLKGAQVLQKILGFKEYITKVEKYRTHWAEKENIFLEFLPYAILFGVGDKWAKTFEGIYKDQPDWYEGQWTTFNTVVFVSSLNSFNSGLASATSVGGAASGASGFGGGGFSGGGFGGGGGGSW